ncbi:hypothetical protein WAK64_09645 [Bacillus spongiae]|uniref:YqzM family protein n=1 Tax=Bacillus spongiae TaxID=2683610 RepID=A0ABU8HD96_9BACI
MTYWKERIVEEFEKEDGMVMKTMRNIISVTFISFLFCFIALFILMLS